MYIVLLLNIEVNFHENVLFMVENKKDETRELGQEGGRKKLWAKLKHLQYKRLLH